MSGSVATAVKPTAVKPSLAVWKFASCDGCQLTLLDCEDELLALTETVQIAYFLEATSTVVEGPYDVSLVEGSITTEEDRERIVRIREQSRILVTVGACATAGGIQALRNLADIDEFRRIVYARPEYVSTLSTSTPISAHVRVDYELRGCPIDRRQLLDLLTALLAGRRPAIPAYSVCEECKLRGTTCLLVARGTPCLGPVTQAGCGAICPAYNRGCFGCFGPMPGANTAALEPVLRARGMTDIDIDRIYRTFNAATSTFAGASIAARDERGAQRSGTSGACGASIGLHGRYLTGPLARYALSGAWLLPEARAAADTAGLEPVCRNPFRSIVVRAVELVQALAEAIRLVDAYRPFAPAAVPVPARPGVGYGATEAPRGTLFHRYEIDEDGFVATARIVPPTSQNQAAIEDDLRRLVQARLDLDDHRLTHECEQAIRNHDPCISCATHFLDLTVERS